MKNLFLAIFLIVSTSHAGTKHVRFEAPIGPKLSADDRQAIAQLLIGFQWAYNRRDSKALLDLMCRPNFGTEASAREWHSFRLGIDQTLASWEKLAIDMTKLRVYSYKQNIAYALFERRNTGLAQGATEKGSTKPVVIESGQILTFRKSAGEWKIAHIDTGIDGGFPKHYKPEHAASGCL